MLRYLYPWAPLGPYSALDYSQLELRVMALMEKERDLSFIAEGAIVQIGKECDGKVFEVVRRNRDKDWHTAVIRNVESGVETAVSVYDLWPSSPLAALGRQASNG